jgi:hypothetical protein
VSAKATRSPRRRPVARDRAHAGAAGPPEAGLRMPATLAIPIEVVDLIAERAAEIVATRQEGGWMCTGAAEAYAGMKPGRLDDLRRLGKVEPAGYDGRKPMWRKSDIDAYLMGCGEAR